MWSGDREGLRLSIGFEGGLGAGIGFEKGLRESMGRRLSQRRRQ